MYWLAMVNDVDGC